MAATKITPIALADFQVAGEVAFTAPSAAADGFLIPYGGKDHKTLVLLQNTGSTAAKATVEPGDSFQSAGSALEITDIPAGGIAAVALESGRYKRTAGDEKGCVKLIPEAATVKAAVVVLP